jgi:antitoxin component of MazEF toxin-antitoxin module
LIRVVKIGGNLTITIPRALARELNLTNRMHVSVHRATGRAILLRVLELPTHDDLAYRAD